jgi:hypothetical protein
MASELLVISHPCAAVSEPRVLVSGSRTEVPLGCPRVRSRDTSIAPCHSLRSLAARLALATHGAEVALTTSFSWRPFASWAARTSCWTARALAACDAGHFSATIMLLIVNMSE